MPEFGIDIERLDQEAYDLLGKILTTREREVIVLRIGLNGLEPHKLAQIAKILGIPKYHSIQVANRALEKMARFKANPDDYLWIKAGL